MEMREENSQTLELAVGWAIDIVPMLGVAMFTFRSQLLHAEKLQADPPRDLPPIALSPAQIEALLKELPGLLAAMDQAGIPRSGSDAKGKPKN